MCVISVSKINKKFTKIQIRGKIYIISKFYVFSCLLKFKLIAYTDFFTRKKNLSD